MSSSALLLLLLLVSISPVLCYPFLGTLPPHHSSHPPNPPPRPRQAAPPNPQFPYTGAQNGLPGNGVGGILVPAEGDTAHAYQDPPPGAYRGPCPGLNAAANHGFISRDGITDFAELLDAMQNVYNTGYDLAVVLASIGIALNGDPITLKVSIGGDATSQTAFLGGLGGALGPEGGLWTHNTFEQDASLTRNDYYLANGDNHRFNGTLFAMMTDTVGSTSSPSNPMYDFKGLALYKYQRYQQSLASNGQFFYGPKEIGIYGAAAFLYQLFPGSTDNLPSFPVISSFFGASPDASAPDGSGYTSIPERIPPNWHNRVAPYNLADFLLDCVSMYLEYPVLFGGNLGVGNFDALGTFDAIANGQFAGSANDAGCLLYQAIMGNVPQSHSGIVTLPAEVLSMLVGKLNPIFGPMGCSLFNL